MNLYNRRKYYESYWIRIYESVTRANKRKTFNSWSNDVDITNFPSPRADGAKKIIDESNIIITLKEREKLKEQSQETRVNEYAASFGDETPQPTNKAKEAKAILEKATVSITLAERQ